MKLTSCVACGKHNLKQILDWGEMPLANNYLVKEKFPLQVNLCTECYHLQLSEAVDPNILFSDYPYFSGTSKTSKDFFQSFAETCLRYCPEAKNVFDVACNDGSQLDAFKTFGLNTNGVDPAKNMLSVSRGKGHNVVCDTMEGVDLQGNKFDIITAQNVVAHTSTPKQMLEKCRSAMHDNSYLFICTSQADMVINNEYDTLYHEHISYFNTISMNRLLKRAGLVLVDVFKVEMHGTSYVFVAKTNPESDPVKKQIGVEEKNGLFSESIYEQWRNNINKNSILKKQEIDSYREKGYLIVGCGAAAKGITFLNMSGTRVDLIIDTTPAKWYGSVCEATIYPFEKLREIVDGKILFVILAWNFESEIVENIKRLRNNENDVFINTKTNGKSDKIKPDK